MIWSGRRLSTGDGFGTLVVPLSTGNVAITAPYDDAGGTDAGAVYLFNGATGALISSLRGSHDGDEVGSGMPFWGTDGIVALSNGGFLVVSPWWSSVDTNGTIASAGAVTWCSGVTGINGVVCAPG